MDILVTGSEVAKATAPFRESVLRKANPTKVKGEVNLEFLIDCVPIDTFAVTLQKIIRLTIMSRLQKNILNKSLAEENILPAYLKTFISMEQVEQLENLTGSDALFLDENKVKELADELKVISSSSNNYGKTFFIKSTGKHLRIKVPCFNQFHILRKVTLSFHDQTPEGKVIDECDVNMATTLHLTISNLINEENRVVTALAIAITSETKTVSEAVEDNYCLVVGQTNRIKAVECVTVDGDGEQEEIEAPQSFGEFLNNLTHTRLFAKV